MQKWEPNTPGWFYSFFVYQTIKMQVHTYIQTAITFLDEKKIVSAFFFGYFETESMKVSTFRTD